MILIMGRGLLSNLKIRPKIKTSHTAGWLGLLGGARARGGVGLDLLQAVEVDVVAQQRQQVVRRLPGEQLISSNRPGRVGP